MRTALMIGATALLSASLLMGSQALSDDFGKAAPARPVATYSIVAIDERTGDIGVAVQSH